MTFTDIEEQVGSMIKSGKVENWQMIQGLASFCFYIETSCFFPVGFFINLKSLLAVFYFLPGFHRSPVVLSITVIDSKTIDRDPKAYLEPCQTCKMELFAKIVNG